MFLSFFAAHVANSESGSSRSASFRFALVALRLDCPVPPVLLPPLRLIFLFFFISSLNPLGIDSTATSLLISNARFLSDPLFRWIYRHEGWVVFILLSSFLFSCSFLFFLFFVFRSFNFLCLLVGSCCILFVVISSRFQVCEFVFM